MISADMKKQEGTKTDTEEAKRRQQDEYLARQKNDSSKHTTKANSSRRLSKKFGINHVSAWQILREDLGLKPYKFQKRQKLTANVKMKRKERAGELLKRLSRG
uniref:Transposase n=1 Tax=Acrobeloides nanus TaxID=290746 RepID=A0A914DXA7_9BILA